MRERLTDMYDKTKVAASSGLRRQITDDYRYNKAKLKHLKNVLHKVTVALGTLVSAYNEFSRVKGPDISPDGLLGGLGYIIPLKDIKDALQNSVKSLGDISDCLADELTNPRWEAEDDKEVKKLIKEKKEVEEQVQEDVIEEPVEDEIQPNDVVNSLDLNKEKIFAKAVRASLINYTIAGKQS